MYTIPFHIICFLAVEYSITEPNKSHQYISMLTYHKTKSARAVQRETKGDGENTYICLFHNEFSCFKDDKRTNLFAWGCC
jgi:hypothetical protein